MTSTTAHSLQRTNDKHFTSNRDTRETNCQFKLNSSRDTQESNQGRRKTQVCKVTTPQVGQIQLGCSRKRNIILFAQSNVVPSGVPTTSSHAIRPDMTPSKKFQAIPSSFGGPPDMRANDYPSEGPPQLQHVMSHVGAGADQPRGTYQVLIKKT